MKTALVLACDDNFVAYASVVARRVTHHAKEKFPIVIVSDGVTEENKALAQKFCPQISFIEAGNLFGEREFYTRANFTRATYLRLFFDEILSDFDRVAYIDSDVSPLADLSPLLHMAPKASPVMATYDLVQQLYDNLIYDRLPLSRNAGYLQGGVEIFDLRAVREERIFKDAIQFVLDHPEKCELVDQDALNVVLQGRWQVLDWRWNVLHFCVNHMPRPYYIRHITGSKPWASDKVGIERYLIRQWQSDLAESPWPHKFLPEKKLYGKRYIRPITRAIEGPIKLLTRGERTGEKLRQYLKRLPSVLATIETAAREGRLSAAL
jgi:lipopolysaccharide biosynthesis glycosyltransferase